MDRLLVRTALEGTDHQFLFAPNGEVALKSYQNNDIDLVITDLGMPRMDGCELARRVKAKWAGLPVILLTGWGRYSHEEIPDEVDYVLSKPTDRQTLQRGIARVVNS